MTADPADRLDALLPDIYRLRDIALGAPLRALLQVITEQVDVVESDIGQLYDNWFIETCQDWVVPYLGDLIGYQPLHETSEVGPVTTAEGQRLNRILTPRRDVANTIADRQRKGTIALLEQLAADVAGWPARAVESFPLLSVTVAVRLLRGPAGADRRRLARGRTVDLRHGAVLDRLDGPFDELAHTVSIGRPTSTRTRGRYNIPDVALFVWRLQPFPITQAPASCIDRARNRYTFSILGNDTPLITRPIAEPEPTHIADEMNVPAFIRRRAFDERTPDYYGPSRSLFIWRDAERHPVRLEHIVPADLSAWAYRPKGDQVAVDPVLGRIAFSPRSAPESGVWVSYFYGFSDRMGGGEYQRPVSPAGDRPVYQVGAGQQHHTLMAAVEQWQHDKSDLRKRSAIIEITDSGVYEEPIEIDLDPGDRLELRAAQGTRPVIRLLNWYSNRPDSMQVRGRPLTEDTDADADPDEAGQAPRLLLDGLLITGRGVRVTGVIGTVTIRHCTLVPGWSIGADCEPDSQGQPSVDLARTTADLVVERSIVGPIQVNNSMGADPIMISLSDSILDATSPTRHALTGPDGSHAAVRATIVRCTVFGRICVQEIDLAEDSIFIDDVSVARRQTGCVRFCSVTVGSRTPRRYHCQPDLVRAAAADPAAAARETQRVRPQCTSVRYGTPGYAQLTQTCAAEITSGAHNESEMGAFHDLFAPQRQANLRTRLDQYTPAGMETGLFFVT